MLFCPKLSSHVIPTLAGAVAWDLWLRFFLSAGVHTACLRNCCRPFGAVFSSHVIPTLAGAVAWDLWLRYVGVVLPFS